MVSVATVDVPVIVRPAALFTFTTLYVVYDAAVCAVVPLKLRTEPATVVNVPPVPKFPPTLTVPAPEYTNLAADAVPPNVIAPVTFIVPVLTVIWLIRVVEDPEVMDKLPADKVPVPTAICLVTLPVGAPIDTAPLTVRELVPLIVIPVAVAPPEIETDPATAATSTVTVTPLFMTTVSPATGTALPPHVPVALQLPLTDAVFVDAAI